jgi:hypothetical protein
MSHILKEGTSWNAIASLIEAIHKNAYKSVVGRIENLLKRAEVNRKVNVLSLLKEGRIR